MKETLTKSMADGPQLYSFRDSIFYYGAYHILTFTEQDRDKILRITVDSPLPVCWIELWTAAYDGRDWVRWTTERGQDPLVSTGKKPQPHPSLTWKVQPGIYTIYFVNSRLKRQAGQEKITYHIELD
jgi:hypothetical protein